MCYKFSMVIRVGLIGFGRWGKLYITPLSTVADVTISAICKRDPTNVPDGMSHLYQFTDDVEKVIANSDAVVIATRPDVRVQFAKLALAAKKPVLLEKPMALNLTNVIDLYQLSRQTKTPILVDNIHLFNYSFLELRRFSQFSRIQSIECEISNNGPFRDFDTLFDYGPHPLSMCLSVVNNYKDWEITDVRRTKNGLGELFCVEMKFGKIPTVLTFGNGSVVKSCYFRTAHSDKKILMYNDLSATPFTKNWNPVYTARSEPLTELINFWVKSIKINEFCDWRYNEILNLTIHRILDAIQQLC